MVSSAPVSMNSRESVSASSNASGYVPDRRNGKEKELTLTASSNVLATLFKSRSRVFTFPAGTTFSSRTSLSSPRAYSIVYAPLADQPWQRSGRGRVEGRKDVQLVRRVLGPSLRALDGKNVRRDL